MEGRQPDAWAENAQLFQADPVLADFVRPFPDTLKGKRSDLGASFKRVAAALAKARRAGTIQFTIHDGRSTRRWRLNDHAGRIERKREQDGETRPGDTDRRRVVGSDCIRRHRSARGLRAGKSPGSRRHRARAGLGQADAALGRRLMPRMIGTVNCLRISEHGRIHADQGRRRKHRDLHPVVSPGYERRDSANPELVHPRAPQHVGVTTARGARGPPYGTDHAPDQLGGGPQRAARVAVRACGERVMILPVVLVTLAGTNPDVARDLQTANAVWGAECEVWVDVVGQVTANRPDLLFLSQEDCKVTNHVVSEEEDQLYAIGRGLGADVVAYYIQRSSSGDSVLGCAAHPPERRGFWMVDATSFDFVWAHEVTHVVGRNPHVDDANNLMHRFADEITNLPPDLNDDQCQRIIRSTTERCCRSSPSCLTFERARAGRDDQRVACRARSRRLGRSKPELSIASSSASGREDFEALRRLLARDGQATPDYRQRAIYALGRWGDTGVVPDIVGLLPELDESHRITAIRSARAPWHTDRTVTRWRNMQMILLRTFASSSSKPSAASATPSPRNGFKRMAERDPADWVRDLARDRGKNGGRTSRK